MEKLFENSVWRYVEEDHTTKGLIFHHFICNYGSKANFIRQIGSVMFITVNWVRQRISMSSNDFQLSLSEKHPNSFIHYTTTERWGEDGFEIKEIIPKSK